MLSGIQSLVHYFGTSDYVDIVIMSAFIFSILRILHQNIHRGVLGLIIGISMLYVLARTYSWHLTLKALEMVAFAGTVGVILVFQEDIRRFLESSFFAFSPYPNEDDHAGHWPKIVLRAIETFSRNKVGALLVLQQRHPVAHHIRGGHRLNGEISFPLICSIFDTHSVGHDGAVILKGSRVTRFGAHLPLSRKHKNTGRTGTRHAAALGLSELVDAIIIVVSEETGEIGIAEAGHFHQVSIENLQQRLFAVASSPSRPGFTTRVLQYFGSTWRSQLASVVIAALLWVVFVAPGNEQQRIIEMAVSLEGTPKRLILDDPEPQSFKVTLLGSQDSFLTWKKEEQVIHVDIEKLTPGSHSIPLSSANLSLPPHMRLRLFEPTSLKVKAYETRSILVPVVLNKLGRSPASEQAHYQIQPSRVEIFIRSGDPGPALVGTEPIDLSRLKKGDVVEAKLASPPKALLNPDSPSSVKVTVQ